MTRLQQISAVLGLCLLLAFSATAAELSAQVDRRQVALDETLRLTLRLDQRSVSSPPDFSVLEADFDILNQGRSTQLRIVNGRSEAWTTWELVLAPKREGAVTIPAFDVDGARSDPITLQVDQSAPADAKGKAEYYVELEVDKERLYPQEQLLVRIRLLSAVPLGDLRGTPLEIENARVVPLGEQQYQKTQGALDYRVYQLDYAVFPEVSGTLEIPPQRFTAVKNPSRSLFDRGRGRQVRMATRARRLEVKPLPPGAERARWLPASRLEFSQEFSAEGDGYRVGEPLTRTLTLTVDGQPASLLPSLTLPPLQGARRYPEAPENSSREHRDGITATQRLRVSVVPGQPGTLELPPLELAWWDTTADRARVARVPARTIEVLPAAVSQSTPVVADPALPPAPAAPVPAQAPVESPQGTHWLLWSNLAWALISAGLAVLWWRARRRSPAGATGPAPAAGPLAGSRPAESRAFETLREACRGGDPGAIRQALLDWAPLRFELNGAATLEAIGRQTQEGALIEQLRLLDRALFHPQAAQGLNPDQLLSALQRLREQKPGPSSTQTDLLPPLYPQSGSAVN
ncbi:BatD family protein [Motiliproteus sp. SC1-56]|uniref:BatD family protein n=1 Tax=Motiliproteus sp. SC1-56 TaxID=2799565 RepID=UPI001A8FABF4|nr:BatD family protein [Motiliproteus sp. SC1-56]